jgi:hypothetical protein
MMKLSLAYAYDDKQIGKRLITEFAPHICFPYSITSMHLHGGEQHL